MRWAVVNALVLAARRARSVPACQPKGSRPLYPRPTVLLTRMPAALRIPAGVDRPLSFW